ncbi:MAG: LPS biosynthesis protein [Candidatus Yanofskybacteria bacterium RIFCSPHIGHO2_01_FULL_43_42]|uniref:LPS biosynthesis protein n=1 Tax=Candidatus Yanofskybacteria bacterium RIFCSPLOWO2_01_FULL_43_22 TaxID=1802695 RepID=A0A1F8GH40_9BACT|nr:MAG: LPS biosynthesis protein [Candidatus Yanofskybacteria bacterium RIFCSPHIGHO2_01_FULL_43_42]OGN13310.1 MAG: LPS biosynthesis protein [Candidatus Yanofskybacteria bacterium RIFCSPHIGHO2_02_FULL_43_17]OGN24725.1 MAG: LPS biosynthesis protein [Candidatus Yanofskybacteria bacterium RIFCSPLOWO2_01_FULL_43_22]
MLPKKIQFCSRCVVSNQRPRTEFDKEGVCNACRWAEKKFGDGVDWDKREKELVKLLDKHRSKDGSFDVLVPGSAGKDSALVIHQLKHKYGMHPLQVTWAPFIYTDIGFQNFNNMIQHGFDGITMWPNGMLHRKLSRVAFELKGDPFEPFVWGQKAMPFQLALRFKIPLIFYGENGEVEYGGSFKNASKPHESPDDWDELYLKGAGVNEIIQKAYKMGILSKEEMANHNFEFYKAPAKKDVKRLGLQMHWWSYYKPWVPQENYYYAAKNTGFEANTKRTDATYSKAFSIDDRLDPFHWLLAFIKFGQGRATREACSDVRCGHITREEAVALVQRYDHEFPATYFNDFLTYLGMTEKHFWQIIDQYRQPHIWKKEKGKWKLRFVVSNKSVYGETPKNP